MKLDPRLANDMVLRLAAWRLRNGPRPGLDLGEDGLAALLQRAKQLPPCDPVALEADTGPFAQLLREARQMQQTQEGQA